MLHENPRTALGHAWPVLLLPTCIALLATPVWAAGNGDANQPQPASARSVEVALPAPARREIKPIAQRIELTEEQKTILGDLQDRTEKFDEPALYVMFAVANQMPQLDPLEWDELDRPAYVNLLADPNRYRLIPLRMRVKIHYVAKLQPGAGLNFSSFWPRNRAVWEMDAVQTDTPYSKDKPVRIYSITDPSEYLGEPDEIDAYKRRKYKRGREVRIAGLFFKLVRTRDRDDNLRDYPELIVWQMSRTTPSFGLGSGGGFDLSELGRFVPLVLLVVAMGAGLYFTRRRLAQLRQQDRTPAWRRPADREGDRAGARRPDRDEEDDEVVDGPVDPELAAAAEQYLQELGDGDDPHRAR